MYGVSRNVHKNRLMKMHILGVAVLKDFTYNDHVADMPAAQLRVGGVLHVDDPAGDEDAQPGQEEILHLNGWQTSLMRVRGMGWIRKTQ